MKCFLLLIVCLVALNADASDTPHPYAEYRVQTYQLQLEYLENLNRHHQQLTDDLNEKLIQQRWQTTMIALMVLVMVSSGLYLSYLQFKQDAKQGSQSSFSFKLGAGSFEVNSSVIGLAILAMSFWFFQTYIDEVYSVHITPVQPVDLTTFGING